MALAGPDGRKIARLLSTAQDAGTDVLVETTRDAISRTLPRNLLATNRLWTNDERAKVQAMLEAAIAAADLLGRARIQELHERYAVAGFAESTSIPQTILQGFLAFADVPIPKLEPLAALEYFRSLIPRLDLDPDEYAQDVRRRAFTMAVATESTLLQRVQNVITRNMETGESWGKTPADIRDLMDEAGVSSRNPQYAELVWRTNTMAAYNTGAEDELRRDPDVFEAFPVWEYLGIHDGRQGSDHAPHFGKFYPNTAKFADVRGERVYNCRCSFRPVHRLEWARLQARGAKVETSW